MRLTTEIAFNTAEQTGRFDTDATARRLCDAYQAATADYHGYMGLSLEASHGLHAAMEYAEQELRDHLQGSPVPPECPDPNCRADMDAFGCTGHHPDEPEPISEETRDGGTDLRFDEDDDPRHAPTDAEMARWRPAVACPKCGRGVQPITVGPMRGRWPRHKVDLPWLTTRWCAGSGTPVGDLSTADTGCCERTSRSAV